MVDLGHGQVRFGHLHAEEFRPAHCMPNSVKPNGFVQVVAACLPDCKAPSSLAHALKRGFPSERSAKRNSGMIFRRVGDGPVASYGERPLCILRLSASSSTSSLLATRVRRGHERPPVLQHEAREDAVGARRAGAPRKGGVRDARAHGQEDALWGRRRAEALERRRRQRVRPASQLPERREVVRAAVREASASIRHLLPKGEVRARPGGAPSKATPRTQPAAFCPSCFVVPPIYPSSMPNAVTIDNCQATTSMLR